MSILKLYTSVKDKMKDSTYCLLNVYVVNIDEYMFEHVYSISGRIHKKSLIVTAWGRAQVEEIAMGEELHLTVNIFVSFFYKVCILPFQQILYKTIYSLLSKKPLDILMVP